MLFSTFNSKVRGVNPIFDSQGVTKFVSTQQISHTFVENVRI